MTIPDHPVSVLVITGPVGSGKSTVAAAISERLSAIGQRHAVVDQDYLRWVHPEPPDDPFGARLGLRNLAAIWPNFMALEIEALILADVVEDRSQIALYQQAMPGAAVTVVRLDVPMSIIMRRLDGRESASSIDWYRHRAPDLQMIMERNKVEDVLVAVGERTPDEVAAEILQKTGT